MTNKPSAAGLDAAGAWRISYDNAVDGNDDGFEEWWSVTDDETLFRCFSEKDAEWLLAAIRAYLAHASAGAERASYVSSPEYKAEQDRLNREAAQRVAILATLPSAAPCGEKPCPPRRSSARFLSVL